MHTNGATTGNLTKAAPMSHYDKLPKKIRLALQNAPFNYSTYNITRKKIKEYGGIEKILKVMADHMRQHVRIESSRAYGPDHPQAK